MVTEESLMHIGFSEKSAKIYLGLLSGGRVSATQLAQKTSLNRTTVYEILSQLIESQLVDIDIIDNIKHFIPRDPDSLLNKPQEQIQNIEKLLPELKAVYNIHPNRPIVRLYEGLEGVNLVANDFLTVKSGAYYYFGSLEVQFGVEGKEHAREFVLKRVSRGIASYSIRDRQTEIDDRFFLSSESLLRHVRYYPKPAPVNILNVYMYDGKVALISSAREQYAMVIESQELFELTKFIWSLVWAISEE